MGSRVPKLTLDAAQFRAALDRLKPISGDGVRVAPGEVRELPWGVKFEETASGCRERNCEYCGRAETKEPTRAGCGAPRRNRVTDRNLRAYEEAESIERTNEVLLRMAARMAPTGNPGTR